MLQSSPKTATVSGLIQWLLEIIFICFLLSFPTLPMSIDIVYAGRVLRDSRKVSDYNIKSGVTLFAIKIKGQPKGGSTYF